MPAKDFYHVAVRNALIKEGWTITHDPFRIQWGKRDLYVDLGAERLIGAQKGESKIAVEIKSFLGASDIAELEQALGQLVIYHDVLEEVQPDYVLYLAIPKKTYETLFAEPIGELLLRKRRAALLVYDPEKEEIFTWKPLQNPILS